MYIHVYSFVDRAPEWNSEAHAFESILGVSFFSFALDVHLPQFHVHCTFTCT